MDLPQVPTAPGELVRDVRVAPYSSLGDLSEDGEEGRVFSLCVCSLCSASCSSLHTLFFLSPPSPRGEFDLGGSVRLYHEEHGRKEGELGVLFF